MKKSPLKSLIIGTSVAAASLLLAGTVVAQTTPIETPQGTTVIVPDKAL